MRLILTWLSIVVLVCALGRTQAMEAQPMTLVSPITGQTFEVLGVPAEQVVGDGPTDMGTDDDGCRHSSGPTEYDYYIAIDPYSYFAALTTEWDTRTGRFMGVLPPEVKDWVKKEFNGELVTDRARAFEYAQQVSRTRGQPAPDRATFVVPQTTIAPDKKYRYAVLCYEKRGARASILAKISLMGAWAIRARLNVNVGHSSLDGGYQEVNDRVTRLMKDGSEAFHLAKWLPAFKDIFDGGSSLTNEGYLVAGLTYFGYVLRDGDAAEARRVMTKLKERLEGVESENGALMRGLVRERTRMLEQYGEFLGRSWATFIRAIAEEEIPRAQLPNEMLVVAECLRRTGNDVRAADWYLALAKLPESDPKLREDMHAQGKAPSAEAPHAVHLGWMADQHLEALKKAGVVHPGEISGPDKRLLSAILFDGLGTAAYNNPLWHPATGGNQQDCLVMLDIIGHAVMEYKFREKIWPGSLGELWEKGAIKDRNRVNRFHCPVTGKPFAYLELSAELEALPPSTILVATSEPVDTNQGKLYGAYIARGEVVWSAKPLPPGQPYKR